MNRTSYRGLSLFESLLLIAILALFLQLFPSMQNAFDFRQWSRLGWLAFNIIVILTLIGIRVGPSLSADYRERREYNATQQTKAQKALALKEQREMIERIQESRRRRKF